jgi:hypothetical protein
MSTQGRSGTSKPKAKPVKGAGRPAGSAQKKSAPAAAAPAVGEPAQTKLTLHQQALHLPATTPRAVQYALDLIQLQRGGIVWTQKTNDIPEVLRVLLDHGAYPKYVEYANSLRELDGNRPTILLRDAVNAADAMGLRKLFNLPWLQKKTATRRPKKTERPAQATEQEAGT